MLSRLRLPVQPHPVFAQFVARFLAALGLTVLVASSPLVASIATGATAATAAHPIAPDASARGPFNVASGEYQFPASLDPEVLAAEPTEMWAKVFYPTDLSSKHPILYFMHGNHATCGSGNEPRNDFDCSYTHSGQCPAGQIVVPNHEGYNYLADHLASRGYIVVSINANRGITCGNGLDADWGLNLARGRLILKHIREWSKWSTVGGAPVSLGLAQDAFVGKVDLSQVGLMGHSRGGEGVRAALNLFRDKGSKWPAQIPGLEIRGIFEIGAVDGQAGRVLDADDTAWNQILPMCDGDVSDLEGRQPFERMITKTTEARKTPKSITMVWGTNHNFYNTEWQRSDSHGCTGHTAIFGAGPRSAAQQSIAISLATAFFTAHVGEKSDDSFGLMFEPQADQPSTLSQITRIDRDHVYTHDEFFSQRVDDFDQATGMSSNLVPNEAAGVDIANSKSELPARVSVVWKAAGADHYFQVNWTPEKQGRDLGLVTSLDFRVQRQMSMIGTADATDFDIALVDADGNISQAVPVSSYNTLSGPANYTTVFNTVRIPIEEFKIAVGTKIRGVRFIFDKSDAGSLFFANVRFSANQPLSFHASLANPLPQNDVAPAPTPEPAPAEPLVTIDSQVKLNEEHAASLAGLTIVKKSAALGGVAAVEIAVYSKDGFPAEDALPTLVMADHKFFVSRYSSENHLQTLIFTLPQGAFSALPNKGSMFVQYGHLQAHKFWRLPDYDKSHIAR